MSARTPTDGLAERNRTSDLLLPKQARYPYATARKLGIEPASPSILKTLETPGHNWRREWASHTYHARPTIKTHSVPSISTDEGIRTPK